MFDFIKRHKKIISYVCLFIIFTILTFLYSCSCTTVHGDTVWNYGFSYNISKGMIIYRDFNVMQTPLYFFIGSLFVKFLGSYLWSIHFFTAVLTGGIMVILFKLIRWKALIIYPIIMFYYVPSYNIFCLFFLFVILYFVNQKKDADVIMGVLVGLIFLTKQNVGILFIPCLFYSKNKIKCIISFCIPILVLFIYLIYYGAFYQFIDYCFLGLIDFNDNNKMISIFTLYEFISLVYLLYHLIKSKFRDKEVFYILMFQIISYPIFDLYHFDVVFVPVVYYLLKHLQSVYFNIIILFTVYLFFFSILGIHPYLSHEDNIFYFVNDDYHKFSSRMDEEYYFISMYDDYADYEFYIMGNTYLRKLYFKKEIGQYDFLLNGNMGYHGDMKYIYGMDQLCKENSCIFFVEKMDFENYGQFSREIYDYVIHNYSIIDSGRYYAAYSNVSR